MREENATGERTATAGLSVSGVRRTFGDVVAVDSMDLEAPLGQVTALIGPNGSGKTTLLLMLATLLVPDAGSIRVVGFDPVHQTREVRRRIGWMPDVFGTWDTLTCREVLQTVAESYHLPRAIADDRIRELLETVHLDDLADRHTSVLSRGQKQRLGLARALVHDPQVVLLDEPASGLDPRSRVELRDVVRKLAARGKAVLVSSHVLAELDEMADRAVIVDRGRTLAVEDLSSAAVTTQTRTWRVRSLDAAALLRALAAHGVPARFPAVAPHPRPSSSGNSSAIDRGGVEIELAGDDTAAELLADLVRDGVPIVSFSPAAGALEHAYLTLTANTEERR